MKIPLYLQTILGLIGGALTGIFLGPEAAPLGEFSKWVIELIKLIAIPLLFVAITDAIYSSQIKGKGVTAMVAVCVFNALCAITIALLISNIFHPGTYLPLKGTAFAVGFTESQLMSNLSAAFSADPKASILSGTTLAIALALASGVILLILRITLLKRTSHVQNIEWIFKRALEILFRLMHYVVLLIPFAVFCSVAKVIGLHGNAFVHGLLVYLFACLAGMAIHVGLVYQGWVKWKGKIPLKTFWKEAKEPVVHSFGINSSLATLPITLKALKQLKVSEGAARLGACIGTNLNNDGILLYEVFATLFLAQAYGVHLDLIQQLMLASLCVVATIGVAGVPEAGIISLSLLAAAVGLPAESIPILLTVDWIIARVRSMVNVTGDLTVSIAIDRFTADPVVSGKPVNPLVR